MLFGMGGGLSQFRDEFRAAMDDEEVSTVVLNIDSPGGLVDLVPEVAAEIRGARGAKPIVAVANTRASSAAYWLASQADELAVTPSGEVGSVGVYLLHTDWSGANEKEGIAPTYISAGKFKTEANPDEPLTDDAREHLQALVDDSYGMFVSDVAAGRGVSEADVRGGFGEGRVLPAAMALDAGMVDSVETLEQVVARTLGEVREPADGVPADDPELEARALLGAAARQSSPRAEVPADGPPEDGGEPVPAAVPPWLELVRPGH
jgi:signal peptide peptidase SppA